MSLVAQVLQRREAERERLMRESLREIAALPENWSPRYTNGHGTKHIHEHSGATETAEDRMSAEDAAWRQTPGFRPEGL